MAQFVCVKKTIFLTFSEADVKETDIALNSRNRELRLETVRLPVPSGFQTGTSIPRKVILVPGNVDIFYC